MVVKKKVKKKNQIPNRNNIVMLGIIVLLLLLFVVVKLLPNNAGYKVISRVEKLETYTKQHSNFETKAWLKINGTNIDYPIIKDGNQVEYEENDIQYLWSNGDLDKLNRINYILGHNIMNLSANPLKNSKDHVRFEPLLSYAYLDFTKEHEYIQFTIDGKDYVFKVFAVSFVNSYQTPTYNIAELNDEDVKSYIEKAEKSTIYNFDIDVNEKDTILSLMTCTRMFGGIYNNSFKVDARLVRDGESTTEYNVAKSDEYKKVDRQMKGDAKDEKDA